MLGHYNEIGKCEFCDKNKGIKLDFLGAFNIEIDEFCYKNLPFEIITIFYRGMFLIEHIYLFFTYLFFIRI